MESKRLQLPRKSTVVKIKIKLHVLRVLKSNHCRKSKRSKTKNQRITFQGAKNQKNQKGSLFKHQNPRKIKTSKFKQNDELSFLKVEHAQGYQSHQAKILITFQNGRPTPPKKNSHMTAEVV